MAPKAICLAHLDRHDEARAIRERFGDLGSAADESAAQILVSLLEAAVLGRDHVDRCDSVKAARGDGSVGV